MPKRPCSPTTRARSEPLQDHRLRLIFTCCHPALVTDAQVALTLRLLGGLTAGGIAQGFLVAEATMAKRLTRAKQKIKANRILTASRPMPSWTSYQACARL